MVIAAAIPATVVVVAVAVLEGEREKGEKEVQRLWKERRIGKREGER